MNLPRIAVVSTGGTISMLGTSRLDLAWYGENRALLENGSLLASVPEAAEIADVTEIDHSMRFGSALVNQDWVDLAIYLNELAASPEVDGIVVTHGTNTLEETAYFLSLTLDRRKPVVVTGAMRPASAIAPDGLLNVLDAVRVAASPLSRDRGVLVVMEQRIFAPRDVAKTSTYDTGAFRSPDSGPLGYADLDGAVRFSHYQSVPGAALPKFDLSRGLPRVDVVVSYVGADGTAIDAFVAAGARGIVSAGSGAGRPTPDEDQALIRARDAGVVICQSSRIPSGRVFASPLRRKNQYVVAGGLGPWKARCLLALALTTTSDPARIQAIFDAA